MAKGKYKNRARAAANKNQKSHPPSYQNRPGGKTKKSEKLKNAKKARAVAERVRSDVGKSAVCKVVSKTDVSAPKKRKITEEKVVSSLTLGPVLRDISRDIPYIVGKCEETDDKLPVLLEEAVPINIDESIEDLSAGEMDETFPPELLEEEVLIDGDDTECLQEETVEPSTGRETQILERKQNGVCNMRMDAGKVIAFSGKFKMRVVSGEVEVFGKVIKQSEKFYNVYAPLSHCGLTIKSKCQSEVETEPLKDFKMDYILSFDKYKHLFRSPQSGHCEGEEDVSVRVDPLDDSELFVANSSYSTVTSEILKSFHQRPDVPPIVVVSGGKNSGKSTYCRYLTNCLLNECDEVCFLECDVGQTEFTPTGFLSLTIVTEPLLGPSFTHQTTPHSSVVYGYNSPKPNPKHYINCIEYLLLKYKQQFSHRTLVINTCGWNKGLGLHLLIDIVTASSATHIVQIESELQSKNMPALTDTFREKYGGWKNTLKYNVCLVSPRLLVLKPKKPMFLPVKYKASDRRDLSILACLSDLFDSAKTFDLNSVKPYSVSWCNVCVHVTHPDLPLNQLLYTLNASLVALCTVKPRHVVDNGPELPKLLRGSPVLESFGLGVVRAIDPDQKLFYILTNVPPAQLSGVNVLVRGDVNLPNQLFINQEVKQGGMLPYVSADFPYNIAGAGAMIVQMNHQQQTANDNRR